MIVCFARHLLNVLARRLAEIDRDLSHRWQYFALSLVISSQKCVRIVVERLIALPRQLETMRAGKSLRITRPLFHFERLASPDGAAICLVQVVEHDHVLDVNNQAGADGSESVLITASG